MLRTVLVAAIVLIAGLAVLYITGPRVQADTTITFDPASIGGDPVRFLAEREAGVPNLREGVEKEIVWADPQARSRTPLAIVYVHGFSASKGEVRPVPDMVAEALGANVYYARLAGHGQDGAAMAEATVNQWVNDYAEAVAIGRLIGEQVIVMATSTGAPLATWGATQPALAADIAGLVFISPNFAVNDRGAFLLTMPWGGLIAELVVGKERVLPSANELHNRYWTSTYPVAALLPMAATARLGRETPVETIDIPALFIFSDADKVVRADVTRTMAERWGAPIETMIVEGVPGSSNHVIAGDAFAPQANTLVAGRIEQWIRSLSQ